MIPIKLECLKNKLINHSLVTLHTRDSSNPILTGYLFIQKDNWIIMLMANTDGWKLSSPILSKELRDFIKTHPCYKLQSGWTIPFEYITAAIIDNETFEVIK